MTARRERERERDRGSKMWIQARSGRGGEGAATAIGAFEEESSAYMSGPGPERPGNNERLGRRGNFIARSAGRCVCDEAERQTRSKRGEPGGELGDSGARFIEFSKYPCTRRCRTRRLHFSTASIYLALPFSFFFSSSFFFLLSRALLSAPAESSGAPPPSPLPLRSDTLSRALPFRPVPVAGSVAANDSRFLNFAFHLQAGMLLRGFRIRKLSGNRNWKLPFKTANFIAA